MKKIVKEQYRKLLLDLTIPDNIENELVAFKKIINVGMKILWDHKKTTILNEIDNDGHLSFQMTLLKSISLMKLSSGLQYFNDLNNTHLNNIYDPFGMGIIVRSQYEAFCNFNNIYLQSINSNEVAVKYYLWVIAGLNSRQRFPTSEKTILKREKEAQIIKNFIDLLHKNICFDSLSSNGKLNIQKCIKKREWQIVIDGSNSYKKGWHELFSNAGVNNIYDEQYNYLSTVSHPSNLSIIQFREMYEGENLLERSDFHSMKVMLNTSKSIAAFFIRDYITYFKLYSAFNDLPIIDQMLVNVCNMNFRGEKYLLNNSLELLN